MMTIQSHSWTETTSSTLQEGRFDSGAAAVLRAGQARDLDAGSATSPCAEGPTHVHEQLSLNSLGTSKTGPCPPPGVASQQKDPERHRGLGQLQGMPGNRDQPRLVSGAPLVRSRKAKPTAQALQSSVLQLQLGLCINGHPGFHLAHLFFKPQG